jgi:hypothetical protein
VKLALDSMPAIRRAVFGALPEDGGHVTTSNVAGMLGYPTNTARRALEDLAAHRVVTRHQPGPGLADAWALSEWTRNRLAGIAGTVPEMSGPPREHARNGLENGSETASLTNPLPVQTDISGTPPSVPSEPPGMSLSMTWADAGFGEDES